LYHKYRKIHTTSRQGGIGIPTLRTVEEYQSDASKSNSHDKQVVAQKQNKLDKLWTEVV
jgi:hypothetical protein